MHNSKSKSVIQLNLEVNKKNMEPRELQREHKDYGTGELGGGGQCILTLVGCGMDGPVGKMQGRGGVRSLCRITDGPMAKMPGRKSIRVTQVGSADLALLRLKCSMGSPEMLRP